MAGRVTWTLVIVCVIAGRAGADQAAIIDITSPSDRIEAVQSRAWVKRGSLAIEPYGSYAFNDPFLVRGGAGGRAIWWPRSLIGLTLEGSGWSQGTTVDAVVAQQALHAAIRPTGSSWLALAGAEVAAIDGKIGVLHGIVPFEILLRLGAGAASSAEAVTSSPSLALSAGGGVRWFVSSRFAVDTSFTWRSAAITRSLGGSVVPARDTAVSFDIGVPFRLGGEP